MPRSSNAKDTRAALRPKNSAAYVLSFEAEHFYQGMRIHWTVCTAQDPDRLVSWGHAPTQELAESAARREVEDLSAGRSQGGRVMNPVQAHTRRQVSRDFSAPQHRKDS